jgi:RNA polymerase sigma-70 factor (ECF subfamily)
MSEPAPVSFEELYAQRRWVHALALRLVRDPGAADDVAQQTWLAAIEDPPRPGNLRGWLAAVVRSKAWKLRRGRERRARHEEMAAVGPRERPPEEVVASAEVQRRLVNAVMELDEPYRSTVLLRFFESVPPAEIARRTGVPHDTVKTRLRRATEMLRARLDREHGGDRRAWAVALLAGDFGEKARRATPHLAHAAMEVAAMVTTKQAAVVLGVILLAGGAVMWHATRGPSAANDPSSEASSVAAVQGASVRPRGAPERVAPADATAEATAAAAGQTAPAVEIDRARDLHGEVVGTDGAPVAGATLRIEDVARGIAPFTTAVDGRFVMRLTPGDAVDLLVEAAGFARQRVPGLSAGERVRIVLPRAVSLRVTVTGSDGRPAAGVPLKLRPPVHPVRAAREPHDPPQDGVTGEDGSAVFGGLSPRADIRVNAWPARGDAPGSGTTTLPADGEGALAIVLVPGATLRGRVTDAVDGQGLAARITLTTGIGADRSADAAEGGEFSITGDRIGSGTWLRVAAPGHVAASVGVADQRFVEVALRRSGTALLRCVDEAGRGVPGVRVQITGQGGAPVPDPLSTDSDGRLRIEGLDPQVRSFITFLPRDLAPASVSVDFAPTVLERDLGDVVLVQGSALPGRVVHADGTPAPRATVSIRRGTSPIGQQRCADDLGRFLFPHVAPGEWTIGAAEGGLPYRFGPLPAVANAADGVTLVVEARRDLRVECADERGEPVAGVDVVVQGSDQMSEKLTTGADGAAHLFVVGRATAQFVPPADRAFVVDGNMRIVRPSQTTARFTLRAAGHATGVVLGTRGETLAGALFDVWTDGRFTGRFTTAADGRFDVVVPAAGSSSIDLLGPKSDPGKPLDDTVVAGRLDVAAGATDLTLRASPVATGGSLTVRVLLPSGAPAAGAKVVATAVFSRFEGVTDADGRVRLADLPVRDLDVFVLPFAGCQPSTRVREMPSGQEVTLRLRATASVSGRVTDVKGAPAERIVVVVEPASGGQRFSASTGKDGAFRVEFPAEVAGPLVVNVQSAGRGGLLDVFVEDVAPGTEGLEIVLR